MRILIADDNQIIRSGVAGLVAAEADCEVCGEAKDGPDAPIKASELKPDVILLDIHMPGMNGLEVIQLLRQELSQIKVLVMSQDDPIRLLPSVITAGGHGCVDKMRLSADLVSSIRSIHARR